MKRWYGFEANGKWLGKCYTTQAEIDREFKAQGMTYAILPNGLVTIYGIRRK